MLWPKLFFVAICCAALSGCMTAQERMAKDDVKCQSYGAPVGSPAYVFCRQQLDQHRADQKAINSLSPGSFLLGTIQDAAE